uniref:[histone H3]-lysine(4) N-trimethyltransferase n=1 Tax=Parastrongyloides trichosuri TaxID=131310 RepID=A0A0N4ZT98_PARTI
MSSFFLNIPTFASEYDDDHGNNQNTNWNLLNQVYEKIAENEKEKLNKKKRKYRKSVSEVVDNVVEETVKYQSVEEENFEDPIYQEEIECQSFQIDNSPADDIQVDIQQPEDDVIVKNNYFTVKKYNDLDNCDMSDNFLHPYSTNQNIYYNSNNIMRNNVREHKNVKVVIVPKIHNIIKEENGIISYSSPSSSKFNNVLVKQDISTVDVKEDIKDEITTCSRLLPYDHFNKKISSLRSTTSGLHHNINFMSLPELPFSSLKHKRKITNFDILDPEVHGHAISKKVKAEASAYSRYQIMVSEWKHYVRMVKSKVHGFGLVANVDIPENTYIIEYTGEQIRYEVANIREKKYAEQGLGIYFFQIDDDYVVDATFCGSCSRYMNHSCEANCMAHIIYINEKKKIVMVSSRDIKKGEELMYDYKFDREDGTENKIPCFCGAKKCRKWMN